MTTPLSQADVLDAALGDPWDDSNPAGHRAALEADERGEPFIEGERRLASSGLNAQLVPRSEGGLFIRADQLCELLRTVWRRDPGLALGDGLAPFLAGVAVWSSGDAGQRAKAAKLLLDGRRLAGCDPGPALGERPPHPGFAATRAPDGWRLTGRQTPVAGLRRADALVVLARTGDPGDERGLSRFLLDKAELPDSALRYDRQDADAGLRGAQLESAALTDCPVPDSALLDAPGQGFDSLRSAGIARSLLPAVGLGALDSALRAVTAMALETRVCGRGMAEVPLVRSTLTGVFADLLAADALCATTLRALHLLPEQAAVYAPSCGYLSARLLREGLEDLRVLLGTRSALPEGRPAIVRKLARDSSAAVFGSCSSYSCLAAILPQLPSLARGGRAVGWSGSAEPPRLLFDLGAELPELGFAPAPADARDAGHFLNTLIEAAGNGGAGVPGPVGRLARRLREQAARLRAECAGFGPADLAEGPGAHAFEAASRSAVLLAAGAGRGVHRHRPDLLDETALAAVLDRLVRRLPAAGVLTQTERMEVEDHLWLELLRRVRQTRLLDLSARRVPG